MRFAGYLLVNNNGNLLSLVQQSLFINCVDFAISVLIEGDFVMVRPCGGGRTRG